MCSSALDYEVEMRSTGPDRRKEHARDHAKQSLSEAKVQDHCDS
jgi:hypothetical protein